MERRTLIRLLVGLAIGIPVLVEALTFLGLVETRLLEGGAGPPASPTEGVRRVGVGDELLPDTPQAETVTDAVVSAGDTPWVFVMTIDVENPTDAPYELQLRRLTLDSGETVAGTSSTGLIPPGESGRVTGAWELPAQSRPVALSVVAIEYRPAGRSETTTTVALSRPAIRNR